MNAYEIEINRVAQAQEPGQAFESWWQTVGESEKDEAVSFLTMAVAQAQPERNDVASAAARMGIGPGALAVGYLSAPSRSLRNSVLELWSHPRFAGKTETVAMLVGLLSVADERRREKCGGSCRHWWHQDLDRLDSGAPHREK